jgi:hypothetical protein
MVCRESLLCFRILRAWNLTGYPIAHALYPAEFFTLRNAVMAHGLLKSCETNARKRARQAKPHAPPLQTTGLSW